MNRGWWRAALAALTLGSGIWFAADPIGTASGEALAAQPSIDLEIEFVGGFAFVKQDPRLDVAYLGNTSIKLSETRPLKSGELDRVVCSVPQIGTQLEIVYGNIVSAIPPNAPELPTKVFNLDTKEVTFQALEAGNTPPVANHTWPPVPPLPTPPSDPAQWLDLRFVAGLTKHHSIGPHPNWHTKVNGRLRLKGGTVTGSVPSRPQMQDSHFDFKKVSGTPLFPGAMTDRVMYKGTVVANNIVILFSPSGPGTSPIRRLEIAPLVAGDPVVLRVRGLHNGTGPGPGGKLTDFCAFYSLFNAIPAYEEWVEPFLVSGAVVPGGGQASPGFYCPMDWF